MAEKPLNQMLVDEPYRFEFFQAVRLLEKVFPERRAVGRNAMPNEEVIRFRSRIALDFPASEIHEITETEAPRSGDSRLEMMVNFMGMAGVSGVLPQPYTDLVLDRSYQIWKNEQDHSPDDHDLSERLQQHIPRRRLLRPPAREAPRHGRPLRT